MCKTTIDLIYSIRENFLITLVTVNTQQHFRENSGSFYKNSNLMEVLLNYLYVDQHCLYSIPIRIVYFIVQIFL